VILIKKIIVIIFVLLCSQIFSISFIQKEEEILNKLISDNELQTISFELINNISDLLNESIYAFFPNEENNEITIVTESSIYLIELSPLNIIISENNNLDEFSNTEVCLCEALSLSFLKSGESPIAGFLVNKDGNLIWEIITETDVITIDSTSPIILESATITNRIAEIRNEKEKNKPENNKPDINPGNKPDDNNKPENPSDKGKENGKGK